MRTILLILSTLVSFKISNIHSNIKIDKEIKNFEGRVIRKEIYKRDNYICRACSIKCVGKRDATKKNAWKIIQCHHVIKYKDSYDNSPENLITVCLRCHGKIEAGTIKLTKSQQ